MAEGAERCMIGGRREPEIPIVDKPVLTHDQTRIVGELSRVLGAVIISVHTDVYGDLEATFKITGTTGACRCSPIYQCAKHVRQEKKDADS